MANQIDITKRGKGSGTDNTKVLTSDGAGGFVMTTPATGITDDTAFYYALVFGG